MRLEKRNKVMTIPVIYTPDGPRLIAVRDANYKEWTFATGGCKRRENPANCAIRELYEETRGIINLGGKYYYRKYFTFEDRRRSKSELAQDRERGIKVINIYHVYVISVDINPSDEIGIINKFDEHKKTMAKLKETNSPFYKKDMDETDKIAFININNLNRYKWWDLVKEKVLDTGALHNAISMQDFKKTRY
jgi:8-oxo-dGTP pyrophosphatase MutT (NUDIX family)